ncbi:MAG: nicotinate-nucleotide adenylyltransferase [Dehalococcoidia bacterium]
MTRPAAGSAPDLAATRIGMLGGTFDPPHLAHLALAAAARTALRLDRVIFVPAGQPWRKSDRQVTPAPVRLEMLRAAIEPFAWAEASTIEVDRDGPTYTAETLEALVRPDEAWWFVLGADALADMPAWHEPARIIACARLAVARRPDVAGDLAPAALREAIPGVEECIDVLDMPLLEISATDLRQRIRDGRSTEFLLPAAVREVVDRLGLYRD